MFLLQQILPAAAIAMMVAAGICGLALVSGGESFRGLLAPLAIGIAYTAGHLFITGWVAFPPSDTTNWLPYFATAAGILGMMWAITNDKKAWIGRFVFALVCAGALRLLLRPKFQYGWSPAQGWASVAGFVIAFVLLALVLNALLRRSAITIEVPILLLIVSGGTFGALLLSGSMLLGQFASVLGAAVFGTLILAFRQSIPGIVPAFSLIEGALVVSGFFFASLPALSAVLLVLAPLLALIPIKLPGRYSTLAIHASLVLLPVVAALVVAFLQSPPLDY